MSYNDQVLLILILSILTSSDGDIANDQNFLLLLLLVLSVGNTCACNNNCNTCNTCNSTNRFTLC